MSSCRILLVEDDPDFAALVQATLAPPAYAVVVLGTARRARTRLSDERFDLAIIDGVLPDGLGTELVEWLRAAGDRTPIVFVSAQLAEGVTAARLRDALGVAAVLPKPVDFAELPRTVAASRRSAPGPAVVDPRVAGALATLRKEYGRQLPSRVRDLVAALARARESAGPDAEALMLAHRLAGTAGSYGWAEVSKCARGIEEELAKERATRDWALIRELCAAIEIAARADDP